jgi:hypothetical protein
MNVWMEMLEMPLYVVWLAGWLAGSMDGDAVDVRQCG